MLIQEKYLYSDNYPLNNGLSIKHPKVKEVIEFGEEQYNTLVSIFLVYPVDLIVELYDLGFPDFEVFSQYDIFLLYYRSNVDLYSEAIKFFLGDVKLVPAQNKETKEVVLFDAEKDFVFDLTSYMIMSNFIRTIHHIPEDKSKLSSESNMTSQAAT